jgi:hypothetical protein
MVRRSLWLNKQVVAVADVDVREETRRWKARRAARGSRERTRARAGLVWERATWGSITRMAHTLAISCSDFLLALRRNEREHRHINHHYLSGIIRNSNEVETIFLHEIAKQARWMGRCFYNVAARVVPALWQHSHANRASYGLLLVFNNPVHFSGYIEAQ